MDATEWAPLDFPFALYRQVAASRDATENVVISPVTALLELDAIARESETEIAEGIAERLGFSGDVEAMHAYFDELTEELESRRPEDGAYFLSRARYAVDETAEERLRQALSIDWVSLRARSDLADLIDLAPVLTEMGFEGVPALNHRFLQPSRFVLELTGVNDPEPIETSPVGVTNLASIEREDIRDSFDRPYLFFIYDRPTKIVLLMGRVADP